MPGASATTADALAAQAPVAGSPPTETPPTSRKQKRQAEAAYLAGANRLQHDDLDAAEREFKRALVLDPANRDYAIAISMAREHRVNEVVQQAGRARQSGDLPRAETLLREAFAIDPENPLVTEHMSPAGTAAMAPATIADAASAALAGGTSSTSVADHPLTDRNRMIATRAAEPWVIQAPVLAGAIRLTPTLRPQSFHLRGESEEVLRQVASAYGIHADFDASVEHKEIRFDMEGVRYEEAMRALGAVAHVFAVPVDETTLLFAKDDSGDRLRLERLLEETISLPGLTTEQMNDVVGVMRNIFDVKQVNIDPGSGTVVVRAPEATLGPMNHAIEGLIDSEGEVMVEVKLYEVSTTRGNNIGGTLPTQLNAFNVQQAATSLVNANQALVQQAIAQGYISATASNLQIALALIGSGLVQSSLASNLIGVFGGGLVQTGVSASTNTQLNLGLNSTDTRELDDVQIRVGDRQPATFREGTRYPIITSTYTSGLSTAASALSNASINGVSVASLLSQFAGGTSATIPQVTYEDLGITLDTTPAIQKSGRVNLKLSLKIEALAGGSSNGIPVLGNRQIASDITVGDGESAMLVSNVTRNESVAMTGIPGLSELPGFQLPIENNTEKDTSQLVLIVTPHVVRRRSDVVAGPRISVAATATN